MSSVSLALLLFIATQRLRSTCAAHISGEVTHISEADDNSLDLYYLTKFAVSSEAPLQVFGTTELIDEFVHLQSRMLLALLPQNTSNHLLTNVFSSNYKTCDFIIPRVFDNAISVDDDRCVSGFEDLYRQIPCANEFPSACNQPLHIPVKKGSNFTFHISDSPETQFYYLYVIACDRNFTQTCKWRETIKSSIRYDVSLVNPENDSPFAYHFSQDLRGMLDVQIIFCIFYLLLLTFHISLHTALCRKCCRTKPGYRMHTLISVFTASLFFELLHVILHLIHYSVYAVNGSGAIWSLYIGEVCNQLSDWLLILVLIFIGKGWMVTTSTLRWKKLTFGIWGFYVFFFLFYFIWTVLQKEVFPLSVSLDHTFQSWPGSFYLAYRLFLLAYILYELRHVYLVENRPEKLKLYFSMGFLYSAWFLYLPVVVFIVAFINPVYKFRVVAIFVLCFDYLANIGMVLLFAPRWAERFFQFESHLNEIAERRGYKGLGSFYGSSDSTKVVKPI